MARRRFGSYLIEEGLISESILSDALEYQRLIRGTTFDDGLVALGLLSPPGLEKWRARHLDSLSANGGSRYDFAHFLVEEGVLTRQEVLRVRRNVVEAQRRRIGEVLVHQGAITQKQLEDIVSRRLGELVALAL